MLQQLPITYKLFSKADRVRVKPNCRSTWQLAWSRKWSNPMNMTRSVDLSNNPYKTEHLSCVINLTSGKAPITVGHFWETTHRRSGRDVTKAESKSNLPEAAGLSGFLLLDLHPTPGSFRLFSSSIIDSLSLTVLTFKKSSLSYTSLALCRAISSLFQARNRWETILYLNI